MDNCSLYSLHQRRGFELKVFVLLRANREHLVSCLQQEVAKRFSGRGGGMETDGVDG